MGVPDHFTCLLRNLYVGQEATVKTAHGTMDWFKLGKKYDKAVYCHPAYLTSMQSTSCKMLGWTNHKPESRLLEKIATWKKYQQPQISRWHHPNGQKWRETKEPLNEGERVAWKSWLKTQHSDNEDHGIQSYHFMINRGDNLEAVTVCITLVSNITYRRMKLRLLCPWKESSDKSRQYIIK